LHAMSGEVNPPCVQVEKALTPLRGALRVRAVIVPYGLQNSCFLLC